VDVSAKAVTAREARAECLVVFPAAVAKQLRAGEMRSAKGPVLDTAIIAGTMAVKRTHELIPFCHPLPIEGCCCS
jgi:cyclic pyranopterin phosphate synthase